MHRQKNKNEMVYDGSGTGGVLMGGSGDNLVEHSAVKYIKFKKLSYDEKKKIITKYLKNTAKISGRNGNSSVTRKVNMYAEMELYQIKMGLMRMMAWI